MLLLSLLAICSIQAQVPETGIWSRFELEIKASATYNDPYTDTRFLAEFTGPDKKLRKITGFYAGDNTWKVRFMPDLKGQWKYRAWLEWEKKAGITGKFNCVASDIPGMISKDETNPVWFGFKGGNKILIRSLHAGDRFFASNWSDSERDAYLDWFIENDYNTISIASHLLNRNAETRGKGWDTPDLWDEERQRPDPDEYDKMEVILDKLAQKKIIVFPFAGFLGQQSDHPRDSLSQSIYLDYTIARLGSYWNLLYSVAGPEPLLRNVNQFTKQEVDKLGEMIAMRDPYSHLLTVHNAKNRNPFVNSPWASYQCLQGPTTLNLDTLYLGLMSRRHPSQPLYAQEVLWTGNRYQQEYGEEHIRKNAYTIIMAGGALNYSDNAGNSSTGFSGTLNLAERKQEWHDIIKKVWDFFETIPFQRMSPSAALCDNGYCMAENGSMYLAYLPEGGQVNINTTGGNYHGVWIKGSDTSVKIETGLTTGRGIEAPTSDDWLLLLSKEKVFRSEGKDDLPVWVAKGSYPDITADASGKLHLVYVRDGRLFYRWYLPEKSELSDEIPTPVIFSPARALWGPNRSDPEVVAGSDGTIHIFAGQQFAFWNGMAWVTSTTMVTRDTDMAVDGNGTVYLCTRGGFNGGHVGLVKKEKNAYTFSPVKKDPDTGTIEGAKWKGVNNHVYGSISTDHLNRIHLVYRQAQPEYVSYRVSSDGGETWKGCGVYGGTEWQGEAPDICVTPSGEVFVISHSGELFTLAEKELVFRSAGKMVSCGNRDLPSVNAGENNAVAVTSFGGKYNIYSNGTAGQERKISPVTGQPVGFADNCFAGSTGWLIWEEGKDVDNEVLEGTSLIFISNIRH
jgi:hypothetical protein